MTTEISNCKSERWNITHKAVDAHICGLNFVWALPLSTRTHSCKHSQGSSHLKGTETWQRIFAIMFLLGLTWSGAAQNYAITGSVIVGGGSTSTNDAFAVTGTIGQPDAGAKMSGGNFSVEGGFWQAITLVQTPGAPLLQITRNGTQATIFWDTAVTGFILESTTSLSAPINWQPVNGVTGSQVNVPATAGAMFYRLRQAP